MAAGASLLSAPELPGCRLGAAEREREGSSERSKGVLRPRISTPLVGNLFFHLKFCFVFFPTLTCLCVYSISITHFSRPAFALNWGCPGEGCGINPPTGASLISFLAGGF